MLFEDEEVRFSLQSVLCVTNVLISIRFGWIFLC